ncbi:MAG TPA: hypothetical protein VNS58_27485 [Puia sp.]|nr:hypothetical protein [Puia sp.]
MSKFISFTELQQSEFWQFFHIRVDSEQTDSKGIFYKLKPGGFQSEIDLMIHTTMTGELQSGFLAMVRSWVTGPPYGINLFALDITRSFVSAMMSWPDSREEIKTVRELFDDKYVREYAQLLSRNEPPALEHAATLNTYLGASEKSQATIGSFDIWLKNGMVEERKALVITTHVTKAG